MKLFKTGYRTLCTNVVVCLA